MIEHQPGRQDSVLLARELHLPQATFVNDFNNTSATTTSQASQHFDIFILPFRNFATSLFPHNPSPVNPIKFPSENLETFARVGDCLPFGKVLRLFSENESDS
jgi:hypothetical protein